ncbi:family 43 glycosylhydrolase [Glycomyces luteolus]|uniref:Family 43 glycosylhydrolase n=1 Tax=Glycomyces luteolus TaxID=2670330 RepID=A0A9X3PAZ7_9ACTN|nr:family 43 glycosylhydrolase [Glycomyces luteolus]MDA1361359.1 family 43 glycosylhydrolase [Glycomyces luteolus]
MKTPHPRRRRIAAAVAAVFAAALLSTAADPSPDPAQADNPIIQTVYTADPAPLVHNGRVYLYTGHDEDGSTWFTMKDWRVWSSDDMVNWTDHGSPLSLETFSWARQDAWAGQAVERGGKFYWYVPVINDATGRPAIGVAVADSPTGPFRDALGHPLVQNGEIDPTVFIDTDGQAYLYWGNPNLWYVKLNADMISYSGSVTQIPLTTQGFGTRPNSTERPTLYEEGPWVYKRGSLYYMVFAAQCCSEHIAYSTSPGPTGPWTYRGTVMPTQGSSFTNHAGVIDYKGGSYFFYHNGALPGGGGFTRSVAVERFTYNADGTIPQINMTSAGAPQIGTLNPYVRQEAETIAWTSGVETERSGEGGMNVGWIENGDWIKVKGAAFGTGANQFTARVASATTGGRIEVRLDGQNGPLVGTCTVGGTGGWQTWTSVSCPVSGATGTHDLYLKFTGGSGSLFNFDWWRFDAGAGSGGGDLQAVGAGKCLDVPNASTQPGVQVQIRDCSGGPGQQWTHSAAGELSVYTGGSRLCLDASGNGTANGTAAVTWSCHGGANQRWNVNADGTITGVQSGLCLDVSGASTANGALVQLWTCHGGSNQRWSL